MRNRVTVLRRGFMLSASFPAVALFSAPAQAQEVVTIDSPTTVAVANAKINTAVPADPALKITVTDAATVSGPGTVVLTPAPGNGDGAITFTNAGKIGAVDGAGAVTDSVGVSLGGAGAGKAGNTLGFNNSGLITGGVSAANFGGNATLTSSGTIYGGVTASTYGDVKVATSTGSAVRSGAVSATANTQSSSKVDGDFTTSTTKGGAVEVVVAGDVASADGKTKGAVSGVGASTVAVTVGGLAGDVSATSVATTTTVAQKSLPPVAGKTVVTDQSTTTRNGGSIASVTIGATGNVDSVIAIGGDESTISIAGTVSNGVTATSAISTASSSKATVTQNDTAIQTGDTFETASTDGASASKITIADTGKVGGNVGAFGITSASVESAGTVNGSITASTNFGAANTGSFSNSYDGKTGLLTASSSKTTTGPVGGAASVSVLANGLVDGSVAATGPAGATVSVAGLVKSGVTANANGTATTTIASTSYDDKGAVVSDTGSTTKAATGGVAAVTISKGGTIAGAVSLNGDAGATVVNAGIVGDDNAPTSVTAISGRSLKTSDEFADSFTASGGTSTSKSVTALIGGEASVTNESGGLINGPVTVFGASGAAVTNAGTVRGATTVASGGATTTQQTSFESSVTTDAGPPALTTDSSKAAFSTSIVQTGGSVSGTYSGVNGTLNFTPGADGSISQTATKNSTASVSGTVFGNLSSVAGNGENSESSDFASSVSVLDAAATGTNTGSSGSQFTSTTVAGISDVTVSGAVNQGPFGTAGNVTSTGSDASNVAVTGSVKGNVSSVAEGIVTSTGTSATEFVQTVTKGVSATTSLVSESASKATVTSGAAKFELGGKGTVGGSVVVSGNSAASATIGSGTSIGNSLSVSAGGSDSSSSTKQSYAYDSKTGTVAATELYTSTTGPAASAGNASATVAGKVTGLTEVSAARGNATVTVTGASGAGVAANAFGAAVALGEANSYAGKVATPSSATSFGGLGLAPLLTEESTTLSLTNTGGTASVVIDNAAAVKALGLSTVNGNVSANGLAGASVSLTSGSKVDGSVGASSRAVDWVAQSTTTFGATENQSESYAETLVGGAASVTNGGTVTGNVTAVGRTLAEVSNTGNIGTAFLGNAVVADALTSVQSLETTRSDVNNPATRVDVVTVTRTAVGGEAKVSNAAAAVIQGGVSVAGATGSVTNSGVIVGTTTLGKSVADYTQTTTETASATTASPATLPAVRFTQTYVANQNSVSGGFDVTGATVANPVAGGAPRLQTSTVNATINLNGGSATLGNITAEIDDVTRARLTNTTVNLNGSGFLGADFLALTPASSSQALRTPLLNVAPDVLPLLSYSSATGQLSGYDGGTTAVRVLGVETLNKTGAGTFVIVGAPYVAPSAAALPPLWTLDVGNFNITGGEVQLALASTSGVVNPQFGISGNVNNSATLVLGRRVPTAIQVIGDSLVGVGPERIAGISVRQTGNFTQAAAGTTVVGITPSLVRFGPVTVDTGGGANEPLGPVTSGVNIPYFTTVENAGLATANSRLDITGNLNLAGSVLVDVTRDSLFVNGDGYTLLTYTGTGTVTATAASSLTSPFVKFALVHDTTAKTVRVQANRVSYATAASNPNAAAAAGGLDSALPDIVARIRTDAAGGAGYTSVSQIGYAQDLANIASALDFRLSAAQITQVFNELSSAEIYGSLSAVNQNAVFGDTVNQLATRRAVGETLGSQLWITPVGNFAKIGGTESGASEIKADSYGAAGGFDFAYLPDGVVGIGGAYAEHKVNADGTPERASGRTWTIGAYLSQGFGNFYANASIAYGFTRFNVSRTLNLLARTARAEVDANQFDGMVELGYNFDLGGAVVTPFAKAAFRAQSFDDFTETYGGGVGVAVDKHDHTTFLPSIGFKVTGVLGDPDAVSVRPFVKASYTFQGDIGNERTMTLLGGGDPFTLRGVDPEGYGTVEAGVDGSLSGQVRLFAAGGYSFGGDNSIGNLRAGLGFRF